MGCVEDDTVQSHAENVSGRSLVGDCIIRLTREKREQRETIDALVAALDVAKDELDRISTHGGYGTYAGVDEQIDAALALARKGGG